MQVWSSEIKDIERLSAAFKGQFHELEKELEQLTKFDDPNVILLYSRRCLEVILTDLCECELKRSRGTEPLKGIIDKLHKERKVPDHIATSMHGLNGLSTLGTHPKDFDREQVKPALVNLEKIIKWYLKYDDPEKQYFADGIMNVILLHLSKIKDLRVLAQPIEQYRKTNKTAKMICKELEVGYLMEGSFQKYGDKAKLIVKLIKAGKEDHVWANAYYENWNDVLKVQSEAAQKVAREMYASISKEEKILIEKVTTSDTTAYELY